MVRTKNAARKSTTAGTKKANLAKLKEMAVPGYKPKGKIVKRASPDVFEGLRQSPGSDLSKKTVAQLKEMAKMRGVTISSKDKKADIIAKLKGRSSPKKSPVAKRSPAAKARQPSPPGQVVALLHIDLRTSEPGYTVNLYSTFEKAVNAAMKNIKEKDDLSSFGLDMNQVKEDLIDIYGRGGEDTAHKIGNDDAYLIQRVTKVY